MSPAQQGLCRQTSPKPSVHPLPLSLDPSHPLPPEGQFIYSCPVSIPGGGPGQFHSPLWARHPAQTMLNKYPWDEQSRGDVRKRGGNGAGSGRGLAGCELAVSKVSSLGRLGVEGKDLGALRGPSWGVVLSHHGGHPMGTLWPGYPTQISQLPPSPQEPRGQVGLPSPSSPPHLLAGSGPWWGCSEARPPRR